MRVPTRSPGVEPEEPADEDETYSEVEWLPDGSMRIASASVPTLTASADEPRDTHGRWEALPEGHRITKENGPVSVGGKTVVADHWVVRGPVDPDREDPEDHTMPIVSKRFLSRSALDAAVRDGHWEK